MVNRITKFNRPAVQFNAGNHCSLKRGVTSRGDGEHSAWCVENGIIVAAKA
jgi:hypothetical protein